MQTLNAKLTDPRRADVGSDVSGEDAARGKFSELQAEFERGEQQLAALDQSRSTLRATPLGISGAIQVLEELLKAEC
jgi:hypothetical protein